MNRPRVPSTAPPGKIRVIGGSLRNSKLEVRDAAGLRPTPERVRETLFNWLAPVIEGARCLDLFAGTGALGIEAVSRGAREVVLIERDAALAQAIEGNLARLKVGNARVVRGDAIAWLRAGPAQAFDVAFLDPPFEMGAWDEASATLAAGGWLAPNAYIYVESPRNVAPNVPAHWALHREGHAGEVRYALYRTAPATRRPE